MVLTVGKDFVGILSLTSVDLCGKLAFDMRQTETTEAGALANLVACHASASVPFLGGLSDGND